MTTATPVDIGTLITRTPGVVGGRPCLRDTRMPVHAIAARHQMGMTAEEIHDQFEHLDISLIYAALAYYFVNREQIHGYWQADETLYERLKGLPVSEWTFPDSDQ